MKPENAFKLISILLIITVVVAVIAVMIGVFGSEDVDKDNFSYRVVEIRGMTCIKWGHPISYKGGLTCNWDEWESND